MIIPSNRVSIHPKDKEGILKAITKRLDDGQYAYGKYVGAFEREFAHYVGTKYAVMTNSGTTAIEMAIRYWANAVKPRVDAVALPTNTYMATYQAIENARRHDSSIWLTACNKDLMMDPDDYSLQRLIQKGSGGLLLYVHIGGNISETFGEILNFIKDNNAILICDDAHALGCTYNGKKAGSFGLAGCFSLFPTKIVHCGGEGGILTTDNEDLCRYAMSYRHHGRDDYEQSSATKKHYSHIQEGGNFKPNEIQAIIALANLKRLPEYIKHRRKIAEMYMEKVDLLGDPKTSTYYKCITYDVKEFKKKDISFSGSVFDTPLHLQPYLKSFYFNGSYGETEKYCKEHRCLPIYNDMTIEEAEYILKNIELKEVK